MITSVLAVALAAISMAVLAASAILFTEVVFSFLPRRPGRYPLGSDPRIALVIPAHNEECGIGPTLANAVAELAPDHRVLVVADNCTDATAAVARAAGAEVICRSDTERRGKGYALDFAVRHLSADPPDAVVVMDADCLAEEGALRELAAACHAEGRPLQAQYKLLVPMESRAPYLRVASFAWQLKNQIRPAGLERLGLPCQLVGSGMAFPWTVISGAPLATGDLVEDLALGLALARERKSARYYPEASVASAFPLNAEGQRTQRARWETGHLNTIARRVPALLTEAIVTRNKELLVLALDAAVPPLSFLALATLGVLALALAWAAGGGTPVPLGISLLAAGLFAGAILLASRRTPDRPVSAGDLRLIPAYVMSKLSLYGQVALGRPVDWVRSKRDQE